MLGAANRMQGCRGHKAALGTSYRFRVIDMVLADEDVTGRLFSILHL